MPFAVGNVAGGIDIEPYTTIMRYAPTCYWRMGETSGSLVNSGSAASKNITATNLSYNQSTKPANRSPLGSINFNGTTNTAETAAGIIGGTNPTFSIGCWIWTTDASGIDTLIAQRDGTQGFRFYIDSGAYLGFTGHTSAGVIDWSFLSEQLNTLNDGIAHYVSATVYSDNVIIYCDGAEVGNYGGRSGGTWSATPKIFLGQTFGPANRYTGFMSDAFITSEILAQEDHHKIWRAGRLHPVTPAGDNFLDAIEITVPVAETTLAAFSLDNSTIEPNEPGGADNLNTNKTRWFKMSASAGDRIRFVGEAHSPVFAYHYIDIFKDIDGTIDGLELEVSAVGYNTTAILTPTETATYYIRVRGYNMFAATFNNLLYRYDTPPPQPANDDFADAITIDVTSAGSIAGTTDGASIEFTSPTPETDYWDANLFTSVWYKFTANATGNITLTDTSGNDSIIVLFENVNNIAEVETVVNTTGAYDGDQPALTTAVTSGNTYHVQISDYANGQAFTLAWTVIT